MREYTKTEKDHISDADFTFVPGRSLFIEIERCVAEAAVFIAVVSENFCKSYYCNLEIAEADQTRKPIILLFKEHVNENVMGVLVKTLYMTRVRAKIEQGEDGNYQMIPDWTRMCEAIIGLMKIE